MTSQSTIPDFERGVGQRKIRKGTHSCWECRRRKVRCQFPSPNASICTPCRARGSSCRRQDVVDDAGHFPRQQERTYAQRLGRLEELMQRLADRILVDENSTGRDPTRRVGLDQIGPLSSPSRGEGDTRNHAVDDADDPVIDEIPVNLLLGLRNASTCASTSTLTPDPADWQQYSSPVIASGVHVENVSRTLHNLFPSPSDINIIVECSPGKLFLAALFQLEAHVIAGSPETRANAHPSTLAKGLLQLAICMQQMGPSFDGKQLGLKLSVVEAMNNIVSTASNLVVSNDDLIGNTDGLQCVILQGLWYTNAGNLRKAWLTFRRALSLAEIMCIGPGRCLSSLEQESLGPNKGQTPSVSRLRFLIIAFDRHLSLFLGLRVGTQDESFASEDSMKNDGPEEKLEKLHVVICARIVERNFGKPDQAYTITQGIDYDLDARAKIMGQNWWKIPESVASETPSQALDRTRRILIQIQHYCLLVMLHLPYLLQDPTENRYIYSRQTCVRSSREILTRFITFRTDVESVFSCRHIDYSSSIAAMALLLSYLVREENGSGILQSSADQRAEDRQLVGKVKERMEHLALLNQDKLSQESAQIIGHLFPVLSDPKSPNKLTLAPEEGEVESHGTILRLRIPYLGMVNICMNGRQNPPNPCQAEQGPGLQPSHIPLLGVNQDSSTMEYLDSENTRRHSMIQIDPNGSGYDPYVPNLMADADEWPFQGVDTNFWSLLHAGLGSMSENIDFMD